MCRGYTRYDRSKRKRVELWDFLETRRTEILDGRGKTVAVVKMGELEIFAKHGDSDGAEAVVAEPENLVR